MLMNYCSVKHIIFVIDMAMKVNIKYYFNFLNSRLIKASERQVVSF